MKKIKYFLITSICLILTTGCFNSKIKTLVCETEETSTWINMNHTITFKFKKNKINKLELKIDATASSDLIKDNWDEFAKSLDEVYLKYQDLKGITVSKENLDNEYIISVSVDLNEATNESLNEIGINNISTKKDTYDNVKKEFEGQGFTCK